MWNGLLKDLPHIRKKTRRRGYVRQGCKIINGNKTLPTDIKNPNPGCHTKFLYFQYIHTYVITYN